MNLLKTSSVRRVLGGAVLLLLLTLIPAATAQAGGPPGSRLYVVQFGDTLSSIAARFGVPLQLLEQVNGFQGSYSPYRMYVGSQMMIPYGAYGGTYGQSYGMSSYGPSYMPPASGYGSAPYSTTAYIVQPGDTLFSIARRFGTSVAVLANLNRLFNPNLIFAGMRLLIPNASQLPSTQTYIIQPGDNLFRIALRFNTTVMALAVANNIPNPNLIFAGMRLIIPSAAPYGGSPYGGSPYGSAPSYATPAPTPAATPAATPSSGASSSISIMNIAYNPNAINVHVGTTVTWTNNETNGVAHTVTSGAPSVPNGTFDSGTLNPGQTYQFTFNTPGTYSYFCRIHGNAMLGTVVVTP